MVSCSEISASKTI